MSEYELQQWAGLAAGGVVLLGVVVSMVRWSRRIDAIFPDAAKKYGLAAARRGVGSYFTGRGEHLSLQGETQGVRLDVLARRESRGRYRTRSTTVTAAIHVPVTACTITVSRACPLHPMHLVPTGDASFDSQRFVSCDAPQTMRAMLTPPVRAALLICPQNELRLTVTGEQVALSWAELPYTALELQAPIDVVLAMATADHSALAHADAPDARHASASVVRADYCAVLSSQFGFTPDHLEVNRQGRLHPEQRARVARQEGGEAVGFLIVGALFVVAGVAGGIYNYTDRMAPTSATFAIPAALGLALAGACGAGFFWSRSKRHARLSVLDTGAPQVVEGPVKPWEIRGPQMPSRCGFTIGAKTFNSTRTWNALLTPGAYYRVYFVHDRVLSIEPMRARGADR